MTFEEPIGCGNHSFINLEISRFDINRYNFPFITRFDLLPNARFVEFLPRSANSSLG